MKEVQITIKFDYDRGVIWVTKDGYTVMLPPECHHFIKRLCGEEK